MTQFLRLLKESDKAAALASVSARLRSGEKDPRLFGVESDSFETVPGAPFAYWVSDRVRSCFAKLPHLESSGRRVERGLFTGDDFRFLRLGWEVVLGNEAANCWGDLSKGGAYSPYYFDIYLCVRTNAAFAEIHESIIKKYAYLHGDSDWVLHPECSYGRAGLTYPLRTTSDFSARVLPAGCYWTNKGISLFEGNGSEIGQDALFFMLGIVNSRAFRRLLSLRMGAGFVAARSYEEGIVAEMPWPRTDQKAVWLSVCSQTRQCWHLTKLLDTVTETSHAFLLPALLRPRLGPYDPLAIESKLVRIQQEIDDICFDLYGFDEADRAAMTETTVSVDEGADAEEDAGQEDADEVISADARPALLSWCVGVAFGRFDWRLATGEREAPPEPDPFDPLPSKSPGMLPDGAKLLHAHAGILVDDRGDRHDLAHLIEEVLEKVGLPVPGDVRDWLQRDFFAFHLQHYSKSRRKAPVYWPLSTRSGDYTLWIYYPTLTDQTLYTAVNDFVEPKLRQVIAQLAALGAKRSKRTHEEEKKLEELEDMEDEMTDLRDALLKIAPTYHPDQDDGVQITAAPLRPLFRHKPWQKLLKETWAKLEKGDYDWSHLAMYYWPDRVRQKCTTDKSLAIAHGLDKPS